MLQIKLERRRRGWNQAQLAVYAGIQISELCRIETGRMRPYAKHAQRLESLLGIPIERLLETAEEDRVEAQEAGDALAGRN
jgi:transcriptional regulator with XRE-family HTH domain